MDAFKGGQYHHGSVGPGFSITDEEQFPALGGLGGGAPLRTQSGPSHTGQGASPPQGQDLSSQHQLRTGFGDHGSSTGMSDENSILAALQGTASGPVPLAAESVGVGGGAVSAARPPLSVGAPVILASHPQPPPQVPMQGGQASALMGPSMPSQASPARPSARPSAAPPSAADSLTAAASGLGPAAATLAPASSSSSIPSQTTPRPPTKPGLYEFGMLGLLDIIRLTNSDPSMITLGLDLTSLQLNLNSAEPLYNSFGSPWIDQVAGSTAAPTAGRPESADQRHFTLPACYKVRSPPLKPGLFNKFALETLFYIFYAIPRDILQAAAAHELYNRKWRWHKALKQWITRAPRTDPTVKTPIHERGTYIVFDHGLWEKVRKENFILIYEELEELRTLPPQQVGPGTAAPAPAVAGAPGAMAAVAVAAPSSLPKSGQTSQPYNPPGMMGSSK